MKVQAINSDFRAINTNAKSNCIVKAHSNPLGLKQDVFQHQNNTVNFKGVKGTVAGGLLGATVGCFAAAALTGGAALPFLAVYYGCLIGGGYIGHKIEGDD